MFLFPFALYNRWCAALCGLRTQIGVLYSVRFKTLYIHVYTIHLYICIWQYAPAQTNSVRGSRFSYCWKYIWIFPRSRSYRSEAHLIWCLLYDKPRTHFVCDTQIVRHDVSKIEYIHICSKWNRNSRSGGASIVHAIIANELSLNLYICTSYCSFIMGYILWNTHVFIYRLCFH